MTLSASSDRKEVEPMAYILALLCTVMANVIAYYICKWIDSK